MSNQQSFDFTRVETSVLEIDLDRIKAEPVPGLPSVKASIDALGAASAVLLRPLKRYEGRVPDPFAGDPIYEIVDGRKRVKAARELGLQTIHAIVIESGSDAEALALTAAMNLSRGPSPLEEALAISELLRRGYSREALVSIGFRPGTIDKRLRLARAPKALLEAVSEGRIAASTAEEVANLPEYQQEEAVRVFEETGRLTVRDVRHLREARKREDVEALPAELFEEPPAPKPADVPADVMQEVRAAMRRAVAEGITRAAMFAAVVDVYHESRHEAREEDQ